MNRRTFLSSLSLATISAAYLGKAYAGRRHRRRSIYCPLPSNSGAVASPRSLTVDWRATDANSTGLFLDPAGENSYSFFAFMVAPIAEIDPRDPSHTRSIALSEAKTAYEAGKSAVIDDTYRPVAFRNHYCVLGTYAGSNSSLRWIVISFHNSTGGGGRFSRLYDDSGEVHQPSQGFENWNIPAGGYIVPLRYADCDGELGLSLRFSSIRRA